MAKGFIALALAAAGLAGCGATPVEHRNYREIDPSQGLFADGLNWEWRRKDTIPTSTAEDFKKWQESASSDERRDFEEWRAWQEWQRKNPK
jgi:hypothetical protein